jgi:hypothetical protein
MVEPQQLMDLWTVPLDERADPAAAFGAVYADPVVINGTPMPVPDLVARARALHVAFTDHRIEIVDQLAGPDKLSRSPSGTRPVTSAGGRRHWARSRPAAVP